MRLRRSVAIRRRPPHEMVLPMMLAISDKRMGILDFVTVGRHKTEALPMGRKLADSAVTI
jgi:hypothetical protein